MENQVQSSEVIKAKMKAFADAWNLYDAKQLASLFVEDADFVNVAGQWWKSRADLEQGHAYAFAHHLKNTRMSFPDTEIKFLKPNLAIYHSTWEMSGLTNADGTSLPLKHGVLTAVTQQQDDTWKIVAVHNTETIVRNAQ